jgi:ABC-type uncharacterized transport system substrate-binding protein
VIFTSGFYHGIDGALTTPGQSVADMARVAAAPIYVPIMSSIGNGALAGHVPDFGAMGRQAADTIVDLVSGKAPATLVLPKMTANELTVDWRQAHRWGIADSQIPADAVVNFRPPALWEAYRTQVLGIAAVLVLQAALIVA